MYNRPKPNLLTILGTLRGDIVFKKTSRNNQNTKISVFLRRRWSFKKGVIFVRPAFVRPFAVASSSHNVGAKCSVCTTTGRCCSSRNWCVCVWTHSIVLYSRNHLNIKHQLICCAAMTQVNTTTEERPTKPAIKKCRAYMSKRIKKALLAYIT